MLHQRRDLFPQAMRALQVGGVLGVLAVIVENADRLAGRLSCRLQLCFQALQLGLSRKIPSHHRDQVAVTGADSTIPPTWNSSLRN